MNSFKIKGTARGGAFLVSEEIKIKQKNCDNLVA